MKVSSRGRIVYCPSKTLEELDRIRMELDIKKRSQAFIEMVKYSEVGREAERLLKIDFKRRRN